MKIRVREDMLGLKTVSYREVDDMKCKCTICVLWFGNAVKTEKLKIRTINGVDYLVCKKHQDVTTTDRRAYEKGRYTAKPVPQGIHAEVSRSEGVSQNRTN